MALQSPVLCAATGTLASGVFTPGATIAGYRTFSDVLSASDTVDVTLRDAADAQAFYPGSTWNGSVLTLGSETAPSATIADGSATVWAVGSTPAGRALATAVSASAQRTALGLGDSATLDVGTTSGTVAAGDDPRITTGVSAADITDSGASGRAVLQADTATDLQAETHNYTVGDYTALAAVGSGIEGEHATIIDSLIAGSFVALESGDTVDGATVIAHAAGGDWRWHRVYEGYPSLYWWGAKCDWDATTDTMVTDDTSAVTAALASGLTFSVPADTYTTKYYANIPQCRGPGRIRLNSTAAGADYVYIDTPPDTLEQIGVKTGFNGDMHNVAWMTETRLSGADTLGEPAGFRLPAETSQWVARLTNQSGYCDPLSGSRTSTAIMSHRIAALSSCQGGTMWALVHGYGNAGPHPDAILQEDNPALAALNVQFNAGSDAIYMNPFETTTDDNGNDCPIGAYIHNAVVDNPDWLDPDYNNGTHSFRGQSKGSYWMHSGFSLSGKYRIGIDFADIELSTNQEAITLPANARIYGNSSNTPTIGGATFSRFTIPGSEWIEYNATLSAWSFVVGSSSILEVNSSGISVNGDIEISGGFTGNVTTYRSVDDTGYTISNTAAEQSLYSDIITSNSLNANGQSARLLVVGELQNNTGVSDGMVIMVAIDGSKVFQDSISTVSNAVNKRVVKFDIELVRTSSTTGRLIGTFFLGSTGVASTGYGDMSAGPIRAHSLHSDELTLDFTSDIEMGVKVALNSADTNLNISADFGLLRIEG